MTLILNGTDNSATVPAVTGTDTDTGIYYPTSNQVAIATNGTQAMLVDASQNVGIGTSSPVNNGGGYATLTINGANSGIFQIQANGTNAGQVFSRSSSNLTINAPTAAISLETGNTERMRIDSSGRVLYSTTTSPYNSGQFGTNYGTSYWTFGGQSGTGSFLVQNGSGATGVYITSGSTSWTGTSDGRLKNIIGSVENGLAKVISMNPVKYTWKESEDTSTHLGFIAQEMEQIEPTIVQTEQNGNMGITYTEIIPVLVKAIQELKAEFDAYKAAHP